MRVESISQSELYSRKNIVFAAGISIIYLLVTYVLIGLRSDHIFLVTIFNLCYFASAHSRKFILGFSIFIVYWLVFDYMKVFPNYNFSHVRIAELYNTEKSLFGIHYNNSFITPNEYWLLNSRTFLDIMSGLFYLCWIPVPLAFASYLFYNNKKLFTQFSLTFFIVNLVGFVGYYTYPAAAPWYMHLYGNHFIQNTPGNIAGLAKFDQYFNVSVFKNIYSKSSNVFAAMPSLHSSYPLIVLFYAIRNKSHWLLILSAAIVSMGIWFGAVYTSHHYVLDVLAGITTAIIGIILSQYFFKIDFVKKAIERFVATISFR